MARQRNYWNSVKAIAKEIVEELPDPEGDSEARSERVNEAVDGSAWIIYEYNNETVIHDTENEPDDREVAAMSPRDAGWKKLRQIAAFLAMEADVYETIREFDKKRKESSPEEWRP